MAQGYVTKSTGSWYEVRLDNGDFIDARLKGKFRIKGIRTTNPITVGDQVVVLNSEEDEAVITELIPRKNYLIRKATNLSKESHIIASNIDQIVVVLTVAMPRTPLGFVDRVLATAEAYEIPVILAFNKVDIYEEQDEERFDELIGIYGPIGYKMLATSAITEKGIPELKKLMKDKTTLFTGQSGVGKSSLINTLDSELDLWVDDISDYNDKGRHTTTFAEMHFTDFGARLIDSPGLKSFGMIDMDKEHLAHYFIEMKNYLGDCKFNNCVHINEPGCAIKKALETGEISESRYNNYLMMFNDDDLKVKYR
ncbi:MAG: ribosome small subunit-dependent GTPase A [Salibacteraceae bacterium]